MSPESPKRNMFSQELKEDTRFFIFKASARPRRLAQSERESKSAHLFDFFLQFHSNLCRCHGLEKRVQGRFLSGFVLGDQNG